MYKKLKSQNRQMSYFYFIMPTSIVRTSKWACVTCSLVVGVIITWRKLTLYTFEVEAPNGIN